MSADAVGVAANTRARRNDAACRITGASGHPASRWNRRRHAAHRRRWPQRQFQQLVEPLDVVDSDRAPQTVAEVLVDLLLVLPRPGCPLPPDEWTARVFAGLPADGR